MSDKKAIASYRRVFESPIGELNPDIISQQTVRFGSACPRCGARAVVNLAVSPIRMAVHHQCECGLPLIVVYPEFAIRYFAPHWEAQRLLAFRSYNTDGAHTGRFHTDRPNVIARPKTIAEGLAEAAAGR